MPPEGEEGTGPGSLWRNPDFLLFLVVRATAMFGTQILSVAVGWHVYSRRGEVLDLGLIGLAQFLPVMLLFLVAGMAADRFDRSRIMAVCAAIEFGAALAIGLYFLAGGEALLPVLGLLFLHGAARAFYHPANQAVLPLIVSRDRFANAVAAASLVGKVGQLGGPPAGGLLIALFGVGAYWVTGGLFAVAGVSALFLRPRRTARSTETFSLTTVLAGFAYILRQPVLFGVITIDLVAVLFGGVMGLLPAYAIDILHVGPDALGVMRAMPAAGALAMAAVLARSRVPSRFGRLLFVGLSIFGAAILVFSVSELLWLSLLALAVYGAADMVSVYVRQTLVQTWTPDALRGRVSAVNSVAITASNDLGDFRAGTMAAAIGAVPAVAVGAILTLSATALWWVIFPALRDVRSAQGPREADAMKA